MAFMRLGTRCAVINDDDEILLSKRDDFGTWALPGGRLDAHEYLEDAVVREVREETGLSVAIDRAIGLYYFQGRSRMNVLYRAYPTGGELLSETRETSANRFFPLSQLPEPRFGDFYINHAFTSATHLRTVEITPFNLLKLKVQLGIRWIQNLLSGHPEPSFPHFDVCAVGIISHESANQFWLPDNHLLRASSEGNQPLHHLLTQNARQRGLQTAFDWRWVGLWQNAETDEIEFVFSATVPDNINGSNNWKPADALPNRDRNYIEQTHETSSDIWTLKAKDEISY